MLFVDLGVKVNGAYYRDVLLKQQMCQPYSECQGTSSSSRTVRLRTVHGSCYDVKPQNSLDQIAGQQTHHISVQSITGLELLQERVYQTAIGDIDDLKQHLTCVWDEPKQSVI
jgi:hypothetical protein